MRNAFTLTVLIVAFVAGGCSVSAGAAGTVSGVVTDLDGVPIAGVQIILCEEPGEVQDNLVCELQGSPTTLTDAAGTFEITDVPAGEYIVMYGLPGILTVESSDWDGVAVTRGSLCMNGAQNAVCDIDGEEPSLFWAGGARRLGKELLAFEYLEGEPVPGVIVAGGADDGSPMEHLHLYQTVVLSTTMGITANIEEGQYSPEIVVERGDVISVTIQAPVD